METDIPMMSASATVGQPAAATQSLLGFLVPGGPVRTDFVPADVSGTKLTLALQAPGELPVPLSSVSEVVCFLLPNAPLPRGMGLLLYSQISSAISTANSADSYVEAPGFELLGGITHERPSAVFRTGWGQDDRLLQLERSNVPSLTVTLGVSIEPLANLNNVQPTRKDPLFVAQKIANDLFVFMRSFDTGSSNINNLMTVPTNVFDRWMRRFEARFRQDPNFFMKEESES